MSVKHKPEILPKLDSDDIFKIGGTTVGGIILVATIGNAFLGPVGAASGALIGGFAGAAYSTWDALQHQNDV